MSELDRHEGDVSWVILAHGYFHGGGALENLLGLLPRKSGALGRLESPFAYPKRHQAKRLC